MPDSYFNFTEVSVPLQLGLNYPASGQPGHLLPLGIAVVILFLICRHQAKPRQKTRPGVRFAGQKDDVLEAKLLNLCHDYQTALRLLHDCHRRYPGQTRAWYFEKVI